MIAGLFFILPEFNYIVFPFNLLGLIPLLTGFLLVGKAREEFRKNKTPHTFEESTALLQDGIFAKSRNPVYLGMILFVLGYSVIFCNVICLIVPVLFFMIINGIFIPFEERKMEETFGRAYLEYKSKVGRWL